MTVNNPRVSVSPDSRRVSLELPANILVDYESADPYSWILTLEEAAEKSIEISKAAETGRTVLLKMPSPPTARRSPVLPLTAEQATRISEMLRDAAEMARSGGILEN